MVIPSKRQIFAMLFLSLWLVGWAFGEISAIGMLVSEGGNAGTGRFMIVWLTGWTVGGAFAIGVVLWLHFGKERVTLSSTRLEIRQEVLGVGRSREYELTHVKNLRVSAESFNMFSSRNSFRALGIGGGNIAFDHGSSTIRFGAGIDEAEAEQVVADLKSRHSFEGSTA